MNDKRLSIKELASYYEAETSKQLESVKKMEIKQSKPSQILPEIEELLNSYKAKISNLEAELQINTQKRNTLNSKIKKNLQVERKIIDKYLISDESASNVNIDLLTLSSLQNEEIILLNSIHTYQQILKNIIQNSNKLGNL